MIKLVKAGKIYQENGVEALRQIDFHAHAGEYVSIIGASGSGKSTLMHVLGLLDTLTSGRYLLGGEDVADLPSKVLAQRRGQRIGFIFQKFELMAGMNAWENVALPLLLAGVALRERRERAMQALGAVGLLCRAEHRPGQLSGGQQQRVAVARAMVTRPSVLLADEPTGNLDPRAAADVLALLDQLHRAGNTIVLITHDAQAARRAQTQYTLENGVLRRQKGA